jgi:hypothetical protein
MSPIPISSRLQPSSFCLSNRRNELPFRRELKEPPMRTLSVLFAATLAALIGSAGTASAENPDWQRVGEALGKTGTAMPGDVYRVGMPRTDLKVTLDGVELKPSFALGSWLAFREMGGNATVMGDLVLTEKEITPVLTKLTAGGIRITALHNHLLRASPATFYMHVLGQGDPVKLAALLHDALQQSGTPLPALASSGAQSQATGATPVPNLDLDTAVIEQTVGAKGKVNGGVLQFSIPRAEKITEEGMEVPPAMGTAEAINFQPTGSGKAAITGDFVLTADEVDPVLQSLRKNGIEVTALHSHMLKEEPRLFFMHFWANDDAGKLASGLRAALDNVNTAKQ